MTHGAGCPRGRIFLNDGLCRMHAGDSVGRHGGRSSRRQVLVALGSGTLSRLGRKRSGAGGTNGAICPEIFQVVGCGTESKEASHQHRAIKPERKNASRVPLPTPSATQECKMDSVNSDGILTDLVIGHVRWAGRGDLPLALPDLVLLLLLVVMMSMDHRG